MKASELLKGLQYSVICGDEDIEIKEIYNDSRKVGAQGLFFCIVGAKFDGHEYIKEAIEAGASAIVIEEGCDLKKINIPEDVTIIMAKDTREALAIISCNYYDNPSKKLKLIGVTGTK